MLTAFKEKLAKCPECKKMKPASELVPRFCGYSEEIYNKKVEEICCDDCEHEHLMDI